MVSKEMTIGEVVQKYPDAVPIMTSYGLHCIGCRVATWESLEEGCRVHGISDDKITEMVTKINEAVGDE